MTTFGLRGQESHSFSSVDHSVNSYDYPTPLASTPSNFSLPAEGYEDDVEPTQAQSQQRLPSYNFDENDHLVGILTSFGPGARDYELRKDQPEQKWTIGRGRKCDVWIDSSDIQISTIHCILTWNGRMGQQSEMLLEDTSTNGTSVDKIFLRKGKTILHSGSSVSLAGGRGGRLIYRDIEGFSPNHARDVWAKYDIGVELGRGTFAKVHQCVERATGQEYAIKVIDKTRFWTAGKAISREIAILKELSQFRHDNIVSLYEYFDETETLYLVFERLRGDLFGYINRRGAIPEARARYMAAQMCQAVAYIHSKDVTHRDLKPENVLLTDDSDWPKCKIADFGLAKLVNDQTFLRTTCGTPAYLAPEIALRPDTTQAYDQKVDSWSLGIIFFCMLTSANPFQEVYEQNQPEHERTHYFSSRQLQWKLVQNISLSQDGLDFLECLLQFDPKDRCSVESMLEHPWIGQYVPSYSKVFPPKPSQSEFTFTPDSTDQDTLACSQSLQHLNLSDGLNMAIPGLNSVAQDSIEPTPPPIHARVPSFSSDSSAIIKMPGAFPKQPKVPPVMLPAIAEGDSEMFSRKTGSGITLKRKTSPNIAGSSPLTSATSSEEEDTKEVSSQSDTSDQRNKRRKTNGRASKVAPPKVQRSTAPPKGRSKAKIPTRKSSRLKK